MKEAWLMYGAVVPVDVGTTAALVAEIKRLIGVVGGMALKQPEQEPVAWMFQHNETGRMSYVSNDGLHNPTTFIEMNPRYALVCPLYTTPPQRTWTELTDEEAYKIYRDCGDLNVRINIARAIEAKLKEKNV